MERALVRRQIGHQPDASAGGEDEHSVAEGVEFRGIVAHVEDGLARRLPVPDQPGKGFAEPDIEGAAGFVQQKTLWKLMTI